MQEAAAVRRAALETVGDVDPDRLRERIEGRLEDGSMAPGVLTLLSARAVHQSDAPGGEFPTDPVAERGAGVQLIYEGLRLTRTLAHDPPWDRRTGPDASDGRDADGPHPNAATNGDVPDLTDGGHSADGPGPTDEELTDADMAILVADILVARGFYLLARTEAAAEAVQTVTAFGRDQTERRERGDEALDRNLEADVFELAVVAGTTALGGAVTRTLREYVAELGRTDDALPVADGVFSDATVETIAGLLADDPTGASGVTTSADH